MAETESEFAWMGHYVLNEQGEPVAETDLLTWANWMERRQHVLKQTNLGALGFVSTIFLGLDQNLLREPGAAPILWETMVFGGPHHMKQRRYRSRQEALQGHEEIVRMCRRSGKQGRVLCWRLEIWIKRMAHVAADGLQKIKRRIHEHRPV